VQLDHLDIAAQTAGHIDDAKDWRFSDADFHFADDSKVQLKDDTNVTGLPQ
jgi:hypothetical protein